MNDAALAIIGTGSIGSMALWTAARAGVDVVGFEAQTPAHARSAVGGDTRLFRTTYRDPHPYYPLLMAAEQRWRELEQETGSAILHQCGGLAIGLRDGDYLNALRRNVESTGAEVEFLDRAQMAECYPQHQLRDDESAIFDPRSGFLRTDVAVTSAVAAAESRGAEVVRHRSIDRLEEDQAGVVLHSGDASWRADKVIIAAGAGSASLLPPWLTAHIEPRRIYLTWFAARYSTAFHPDSFPTFAHIYGMQSMYGAPSVDGSTVKATLDGRSEPYGQRGVLQRNLTQAEIVESEETVRDFLPGLIPSIVRSDAYPDLYTSDHTGLLGAVSESGRMYCATGFSGIGFKKSSALGMIAAEECLAISNHPEVDFLRPTRFMGHSARLTAQV